MVSHKLRILSLLATVPLAFACNLLDDAETSKVRELATPEKEYIMPAAGGEYVVKLYANGPVSIVMQGGDEWATIDQTRSDGDGEILVWCEPNEGFRRMAKLVFSLKGTSMKDTVRIKQQGIVPYLECAAPFQSVPGSEARVAEFTLSTNIPTAEFTQSARYLAGSGEWLSAPSFSDGKVAVSTAANSSDVVRKAVVSLTYTDGWEQLFRTDLYVTQSRRDGQFGQTVEFPEVRAQATEAGTAISQDLIVKGIVVSDFHSRNMDENTNTTHAIVDSSYALKTAYLESEDGRYGFRLQFDEADQNVLSFGTRLSLNLSGTVVKKETDPDRYTILGLDGQNMVESFAGADIPVKEKKIAQLTDDDIYTYVTLTGTEFAFKRGTYADVYENYTLKSAVSAVNSGNNGRMDGWASLLLDESGSAIYAPVNMHCLWRRRGDGVPQGVGPTRGVIVHNTLAKVGDVGRYQIRVLDESGFGQSWSPASAFTEYATWDGSIYNYQYSKYQAINNKYKYNLLSTITPSNDISSSHPVPNAELYVENQTMPKVKTSYPIARGDYYSRHAADNRGIDTVYKAMQVMTDVKGWYKWSGGKVSGYNGFRFEFSTQGISASHLLFTWDFCAGSISAVTSKNFPAHWCVEYSTDGGATYTLVPDAVTGKDYVHLRSLPWWDTSINGTAYYTCKAAGLGFSQHAVVLPSDAIGVGRVLMRLRPYDTRLTVLPIVWDADNETMDIAASTTADNYLKLGAPTISYF